MAGPSRGRPCGDRQRLKRQNSAQMIDTQLSGLAKVKEDGVLVLITSVGTIQI